MRSSSKVAVGLLNLIFCTVLSTVAFSTERQVYDQPDVQQPGRTILGTIVKVVKRDAATHQWEVSVENEATGEVVPLRLDQTTVRQVTGVDPTVGDKVVVQYDEDSQHAISFVAVAATNN